MIAWLRRLLGDDEGDPAWTPSGYRYTHTGFDPDLRERTVEKRQREDRIRRAAARVASRPAEDTMPLRAVKGGR